MLSKVRSYIAYFSWFFEKIFLWSCFLQFVSICVDIHSFYMLECLVLHTQLHELGGGGGCIKTVRFSYILRKVLLYIQIHLCTSSVSIHPLRSLRKILRTMCRKYKKFSFGKRVKKLKFCIMFSAFSYCTIWFDDPSTHDVVFVQNAKWTYFEVD